MAGFLGLGNGAVFKMVPAEFPQATGAATGIVGAAGGLGGFFPPLVMGVVKDATGEFVLGFVFLVAFACVCAGLRPPARQERLSRRLPMSPDRSLHDGHGRRIGDLRGLGHRPLQLPLPVLHAGRGAALARAGGDPQLRGDRAPGRPARRAGDRGRPPHRRRAAGPPPAPAPGGDAEAGRGDPRPLADHQRLPARAPGRCPGRGGDRPGQRLDRLPAARPLLPAHPPRRPAAGAARARRDRRPSARCGRSR